VENKRGKRGKEKGKGRKKRVMFNVKRQRSAEKKKKKKEGGQKRGVSELKSRLCTNKPA